MTPRIDNEDLEAGGTEADAGRPSRADSRRERQVPLRSGHVGRALGLRGRYNRYFKSAYDPDGTSDVSWIVPDSDEDNIVNVDSEYFSSYTSPGKFRRVYGAEFQWVHDNYSFAGEYAGLDSDGELIEVRGRPQGLRGQRLRVVQQPQRAGALPRLRCRLREPVQPGVLGVQAIQGDHPRGPVLRRGSHLRPDVRQLRTCRRRSAAST